MSRYPLGVISGTDIRRPLISCIRGVDLENPKPNAAAPDHRKSHRDVRPQPRLQSSDESWGIYGVQPLSSRARQQVCRRARSAPAGVVCAGRAKQLLDVRVDQTEADISVKLLPPLIEHKARTAFDPHLVGILVVSG